MSERGQFLYIVSKDLGEGSADNSGEAEAKKPKPEFGPGVKVYKIEPPRTMDEERVGVLQAVDAQHPESGRKYIKHRGAQ